MSFGNNKDLQQEILEIYNEVRKRVLLYGQTSLTESQFEAFRKLVMDEFGKSGAEGRMERLFKQQGQVRKGR